MTSLRIPPSTSFPHSFSRSPSPKLPGAWPGTPRRPLSLQMSLHDELVPSLVDADGSMQSPDSVLSDLRSCTSTLVPQESLSTLDSKYNAGPSLTLSAKMPCDSVDKGLLVLQRDEDVDIALPCAPSLSEGEETKIAGVGANKLPGSSMRSSAGLAENSFCNSKAQRTLILDRPPTPLYSKANMTSGGELLSLRCPSFPRSSPTPGTPSSPIVFSSPSSSHAAYPFPPTDQLPGAPYSSENEVSWESSYGCEIVDGQFASFARQPNDFVVSSSTFHDASQELLFDQTGYTASPESNVGDISSIDFDTSPEFSPLPLDTGSHPPRTGGLSRGSSLDGVLSSPINTTLEPWTLSLSAASFDHFGAQFFSASPRSPSHSPVRPPTSYYGAEIGRSEHSESEGFPNGHAIILPRTTLSPVSSALSSPAHEGHTTAEANILGLSDNGDFPGNGVAEFAAAFVSSAWGSDGHGETASSSMGDLQLDLRTPDVLLEPRNGGPLHEAGTAETEESVVSSVRIADLVNVDFQPSRKRGVLKKVKAYGLRMKKFLTISRKSKGNLGKDYPAYQHTSRHSHVTTLTAMANVRDEGRNADHDQHTLPLPPGLNTSPSLKVRPTLSPQTFTCPGHQSPAVISVSSRRPGILAPLLETEVVAPASRRTSHRLSFVDLPGPTLSRSATTQEPSEPVIPHNTRHQATACARPTRNATRRYSYTDAAGQQYSLGPGGPQFEDEMRARKERRRFSFSAMSSIFSSR